MRPNTRRCTPLLLLFAAAAVLPACKSTYYAAWEKLGWAKRDILVDRVEAARSDQEKAKTEFQTTLQHLRSVAGTPEDSLQKEYDRINSDYEACAARAKKVHDRITSVDSVARDLFKEWQSELSEYHSEDLRRASEQKLSETQARYAQLLAAMKRAESKMQPVLDAFHDQVLFMKHNLNARAIASLQTTQSSIESDVAALIKDMDNSINEANSFIQQMQATSK
jgi:membrane-bound lytic murein transglycosylase B